MTRDDADKVFNGSIAALYDTHLVPLIFEPYAYDLAQRLVGRPVTRVLELAAGTGVLTRALAAVLPDRVQITATDLNQPMLDRAAAVGTARPVHWCQADAMNLPFEDGSFDAVVCQFGVMFFPDRPRAFAEARRVLRASELFLFNVWDRIEDNEFADVATTALAELFPADPPRFLARTPHGYHDRELIAQDLARAGFTVAPEIVTLAARSRAAFPLIPALAYCQGTPLRNEIAARDAARLGEATDFAAQAIGRHFGHANLDSKIQAHVVCVAR
jgi:ubiquinone/menaquinone biosynthesis C-methylase UbiE